MRKWPRNRKNSMAAKAAYDEAVSRAKNPANAEAGPEPESLAERLKNQLDEVLKGFSVGGGIGDKVSVSGSFSAAAIASMGQGTVMDRVAKATEKSEKHLQKIAEKKDADAADADIPDEPDAGENRNENVVVKELKQHTRYLRDMAQGGGKVFA